MIISIMLFALYLAGFLLASAVIVYSGKQLSVSGDQIAEITGMGKGWLGLVLMASVTSLPELITGLSAVAVVKAPNLAAGDVFGSCMFNLLILSILDTLARQPLSSMVKKSHIVAAIFGIILLAISGLAIFLAPSIPTLLWISLSSVVIVAVYLVAVWGIFHYDQEEGKQRIVMPAKAMPQLRKAIWRYLINAVLVVIVALFLPYFGKQLAEMTGMSNTFFGTLFLAAATSLPELAVSISALRIGSPDIAVGNLLGSNVFNLLTLAIIDVFYREGSLFQALSPSHSLSVWLTIIMTSVAGLGLLFRPQRKHIWKFSIDSFIIFCLYAALMIYMGFKH